MENKDENAISQIVLNAAFAVHTALGPGLLESMYEAALAYELTQRGQRVRTQVPLPAAYGQVRLDVGYRIDLLVEEKLIVEIKSVEQLLDVHHKQLLTYLRLSGCKLGLLLNFNTAHLRDGIARKVNGL